MLNRLLLDSFCGLNIVFGGVRTSVFGVVVVEGAFSLGTDVVSADGISAPVLFEDVD